MVFKMYTLLTLTMLCVTMNFVSTDDIEPTTNAITTDLPAAVNDISDNSPTSPSVSSTDAKCECGVFSTKAPTEEDLPIISQTSTTRFCDNVGENTCQRICCALAHAAKERGPDLLCAQLGHYNQLTASVHSRIYGAQKWTYTGLTSPNEICCHENKVIDCKDQVEPSATPLSDVPPNPM